MNDNLNSIEQKGLHDELLKPKQWWTTSTIVILSFLFVLVGFTVYSFTTAFKPNTPVKQSVGFPFEKEVSVPFVSLSEVNPSIRDVVRKNEKEKFVLEIAFKRRGFPVNFNDMLGSSKGNLPKSVKDKISGFNVGVYKGNVFLLLSFEEDAFPIVTKNSRSLFRELEYFSGRASTGEIKRGSHSNTLIVSRTGDTVYGFLNNNTIAVTADEESFLELLKIYRAFLIES